MSDMYELKCFLHYKEGTSDKIYGILKSKDTIFCFYGKRNDPVTGKDVGTLSIKYYDYMDSDDDWVTKADEKLRKGYKKVFFDSYRKWSLHSIPAVGNKSDVDKIYKNLQESIRKKLMKAILKYT